MKKPEIVLFLILTAIFALFPVFSTPAVLAQACTTNDQCTAPSNSQCYTSPGTCLSSACTYSMKPDGTACDDGNPSSTNDKCTGGLCSGTSIPTCSEGQIPSSGCTCGGATYYSGYCNGGVYSASAPLKSVGATCSSPSECSSGYCTSGYCSSTPGLSSCSEGPIPSSGCNCGGGSYYSGYCCSNVYRTTACTGTTSCSSSQTYNCYDQSSCQGAGGYWCKTSATSSGYCQTSACPACSSTQKSYCYDQTSCSGAGGKWCTSSTGGSGWCSDSCPTCSSTQKYNCYTEAECKTAGGYWYNNYCSSSPPPKCESTAVWNCYDQTSCGGAGGKWCGTYCSTSCPTCSSSSVWNCYDQTSCKGAGGNWCNSYCSTATCPTTGYCGNKICDSGETSASCPGDCGGTTSGYCGDKICIGSETPLSCPTDCGTSTTETCGNGFCGSGETTTSCPADCKLCGEGPISSGGCVCGGVTQYSSYCCNSVFQSSACGTSTGYCGDKICNGSETATSCHTDCGSPTNICSSSQKWNCKTQSECKSAGGYWSVYGSCSDQPQDKSSCTSVGRYWCGTDTSGYCQSGLCPQCSTTYPGYCYTEADCKGAGLNWCGNSCWSSPCPTCSSSQKYNCYTETSCNSAGGKWCASYPSGSGNYCSDSCPTPAVCGNKICDSGETTGSCPGDCGGPTCSANNYWNCYSENECKGAGAKWCANPYSGGYCASSTSSCPSYVCDKGNLWNCKTETECKTNSGYWYNNYCSSSSPPQCSLSQLYSCYDQTSCKNAGGNWCGSYCSTSSCPTCSSSQKYNCYDQTTCTGAGGKWCASSGGGTASGWCSDSCPVCDKSSTWNCYDETSCKGAGGYWTKYSGGGTCSSTPPPQCSATTPWNCYDQSSCSGAGANWCLSQYGGSGYCSTYKCTTTQPTQGYCGWCGDSCMRIGPTMSCLALVPPAGFSCFEESGACVKKAFEVKPIQTCPPPPLKPALCGPNQGLKTKFDDKGCIVDYECVSAQIGLCSQAPPPSFTCLQNEQLNKLTDANGCIIGYSCVPTTGPISTVCPQSVSKPACTAGNILPIYGAGGCLVGYNCVPEGCFQEVDTKNQITRVVCDKGPSCPAEGELQVFEAKCKSYGGKAVALADPKGCKFVDCRFTEGEVLPDPLKGHAKCPSPEETEKAVSTCKDSGLVPVLSFEGGCKIAKCVSPKEDACKLPTPEIRAQLENQCSAKGLPLVKDIDSNGCAFYRCGESAEEACAKDVPSEAYSSCEAKGGEMIVKKDEDACIVYANCITRGDERDSYVEPVEEVPDSSELLKIALKLEQLKVELTKLSDNAEDIAAFYADRGDVDEERFNRVAGMFDAAADRIDDIRTKIRDRLQTLTKEDIVEIKRDIKHLKEVTLKDIVYMMLSNSDDVKQTLESSKKISVRTAGVEDIELVGGNCKGDGQCFERAYRVCKPTVFRPEGQNGPTIIIIGIEDGNCVVKVRMPEAQGTASILGTPEMTCRFKEYSFGMKGPEEFLENCEGTMVQLMQQFGGVATYSGEQSFPPPEGGPGGCKSMQECAAYCLDNYSDCERWTKEHPAYGPTPPPREELQRIVSGEGTVFRSAGISFEGPGGCKGPEECGKFCSSNQQVCTQWCIANPSVCNVEQAQQYSSASNVVPSGAEKGFVTSGTQACVGCFNNGVCDIGECSDCSDCSIGGRVG